MRLVPVPFQEHHVKKVSGFTNTYRVRIGDLRIIYELQPKEQIITVLKIDRKDDSIYKRF